MTAYMSAYIIIWELLIMISIIFKSIVFVNLRIKKEGEDKVGTSVWNLGILYLQSDGRLNTIGKTDSGLEL